MVPILFINCSAFPFIEWILSGLKRYETRNKNTLQCLIGKRVLLAETGKHGRPIIRGEAIIAGLEIITDPVTYNSMRNETMIIPGSGFDWKCNTKKKCLYRLENVKRCEPFTAPEGKRHGRIWMEYNGE